MINMFKIYVFTIIICILFSSTLGAQILNKDYEANSSIRIETFKELLDQLVKFVLCDSTGNTNTIYHYENDKEISGLENTTYSNPSIFSITSFESIKQSGKIFEITDVKKNKEISFKIKIYSVQIDSSHIVLNLVNTNLFTVCFYNQFWRILDFNTLPKSNGNPERNKEIEPLLLKLTERLSYFEARWNKESVFYLHILDSMIKFLLNKESDFKNIYKEKKYLTTFFKPIEFKEPKFPPSSDIIFNNQSILSSNDYLYKTVFVKNYEFDLAISEIVDDPKSKNHYYCKLILNSKSNKIVYTFHIYEKSKNKFIVDQLINKELNYSLFK